MAISDFIRSSKTDRPEKKKKIQRALVVRRRTKDGGVSVIESVSPSRSSVKRAYFDKSVLLIDPPFSNPVHVVRLSDPSLAGEVQKLSERLKSDPDFAMKLLRKAGIATPSGKLSQRYGG